MLINNIDTLKKYLPTIVSGTFEKYKQQISDANTYLKREIIGSDLYELIKSLSSSDETPTHPDLVGRAEAVVATKAYLYAIPMLDLIETESGFGVVNTKAIAPASRERVKALVAAIESKLSAAIEELVEFLEENEEYHDNWKGSPTYSLISNTFIQTLKQFRKYAWIEGNRLDFIKLKPLMLQEINLSIAPIISPELCDQIIEQLRDNDLTSANAEIIELLRYALALFTVGESKAANSFILKARKIIMASPEKYTAFSNSTLYANILSQTATNNSGAIFKTAL